MQFEKKTTAQGDEYHLSGRFTFTDYTVFRKLVTDILSSKVPRLVFDLSNVEFMDSAALGMLLLARDETSGNNQALSLRGASGQVQRVLAVARFDALFEMNK